MLSTAQSQFRDLTPREIRQFQGEVWHYFARHERHMPWRQDPSPFKVLLSEMMLQQTQVNRVIPKFEAFLYTCDNFADLARLPLYRVLELWSGLGYNRRARFLHESACMIMRDFDGSLPREYDDLVCLPGIGPNTAGAILAYTWNQPVVFIETNIRTVLFHHFFDERKNISDAELRHTATQVLDAEHPREWHWALMDYGAYLKNEKGGKLDASRHYKKQTPLKGSVREIRGHIVKVLTEGPLQPLVLQKRVNVDDRFEPALRGLLHDGLITEKGGYIGLTGQFDAP